MSIQYNFAGYNANVNWKKFDVIYDGKYRYATQDLSVGGVNGAPDLRVIYNVTNTKREDDVATVYFTQTGTVANFSQGSIIGVKNLTNSTMNYTGMIIAGGNGWASYINAGWSEGLTASAGVVDCLNPGWTSGFMFAPSYTTSIGTENQAIVTQLGNGYTQRMSNGVNTFNQNLNLTFQNRSSREVRAMTTFVQDKMGKDAFPILITDPMMNNQPNQKFVAASINVSTNAYNLNDINIPVIRVFDP
jgi:phage-related protein